MSYCKYAVEAKRFLSGWSRGAIWAVCSCDFREFLNYINSHRAATDGPKTRVRHIHGNPPAKYTWPDDRKDVE